MAHRVIDLVRPSADEKGISLNLHVGPQVPAKTAGDALRLSQIMLNLLTNAVKFTDEGSVELRVEQLERRTSSSIVTISVVDTGMGIEKDQIAAMKDPFTQGDASTSRKFGGTGLGLAISDQLTRLMGGVLEAVSEVGEGSTFGDHSFRSAQ